MPQTPLELVFAVCVEEGDVGGVRKALEHGVEFCGDLGDLLCSAATNGHVEILQIFAEFGVKDSRRRGLTCAVESRQWDSARFLVKQYDEESLDYVRHVHAESWLMPTRVRWPGRKNTSLTTLFSVRSSRNSRVALRSLFRYAEKTH